MDAVNGDVRGGRSAKGFERVLTFRALDVPHLNRSVRTCAEVRRKHATK